MRSSGMERPDVDAGAESRKQLHCRCAAWRWSPQPGHMPAFYGLRPETSRGNDARQPARNAQPCDGAAAWAASASSASACSGIRTTPRAGLSCIDDSPECVGQRQATLKSMLADKDRKWVKEPATPQAHASGVRLFAFRSRKKELTCEELAHRAPRGRQRAQGAARARGQEPVTGAGFPRHHVRRRGQQGARRRDAGAPLQGVRRAGAAARLRARARPAGGRSAPTPADGRSRRRDPCRPPRRQAPARPRCGRAPPAAGPAARPASSASAGSRARARSRPAACGSAFDQGEVLRSPASTSGPSMWRTSCASADTCRSCSQGSRLGRCRCVPMIVSEPPSLAQTKSGMSPCTATCSPRRCARRRPPRTAAARAAPASRTSASAQSTWKG